jgi:hypothetical protein
VASSGAVLGGVVVGATLASAADVAGGAGVVDVRLAAAEVEAAAVAAGNVVAGKVVAPVAPELADEHEATARSPTARSMASVERQGADGTARDANPSLRPCAVVGAALGRRDRRRRRDRLRAGAVDHRRPAK